MNIKNLLRQEKARQQALVEGRVTPETSRCVQCGICEKTCPEHAIRLEPRLSIAPEAKQPQVVNEAAVFRCIVCGKSLGTEKMITSMLAKLAGHSMFAAPGALDRLKMCADCRVIDMMKNERGLDIRDV